MCGLIYCTTTLVILLGVFYAYAKYKLSYWSKRGVKSPPVHLIFGHFKDTLTFRKQPAEQLCEIYNSADPDDPYVGFYIFHKPILLLRDHELIKQVLITSFDLFPNRQFGAAYGEDTMGFVNLLAVNSQPLWKYLRSKLTPVVTGQKLKNMLPLITASGKSMIDYIESLPDESGQKTCQDMLTISTRFVNDILTSMVFGVNTNSFDEQNDTFMQHGMNIFRGFKNGIIFIIFFLIPEWIPVIHLFGFKMNAEFFRKCFHDSMNAREKTGNKKGDIMDFLLALKNEEQNPDFKFDDHNLLAQAMGLYIAAFESTSSTVAFALFTLARYPEHQVTLYDEIQTHLSGKDITMEVINDMSFLDCVIVEILRLFPPLPFIDRIAARNFKIPGTRLVIEKGTPVYVSLKATLQDPKYFLNPKEFNPLRPRLENKKFLETLAFSLGPRNCLGQRLALLIIKIAIVMTVSNYSLSTVKKTENFTSAHIFSYVSDGMIIQFKKRQ